MAPRSNATQPSSSRTLDTPTTETTTAEMIATQQAEIDRLTALLQDAEARAALADSTPNQSAGETVTTLVESIVRSLARNETPSGAYKSSKIPDPPVLTDGKDPTFESWKLQIRDKLRTNADHFPTDEAKMAYVFSRTGGDAQKHLQPRYDEESQDQFDTDHEMITYLASIYEDPHRVQNARLEYKSLMMKTTETFADFHTRFLHLAGQAKIPQDDLRPDLFDKLTLELQRTVLPVYSTLTTSKTLANECLSLDQGLRRIKARSDRLKTRTTTSMDHNAPVKAATTGFMDRKPPTTPAKPATRESTPTSTTTTNPWDVTTTRRTFNNPRQQGACFSCGQQGHMASDCPSKPKDPTLVVQEVDAETDTNVESGKEDP
jgi:hypothetical protein